MEERMQSDGAIYTNNYKQNEKQPDWTGKVVLDKKLLKALVEKVKVGEEAEMRVALWDRVSKNGNEYKYGSFRHSVNRKNRQNLHRLLLKKLHLI